VPSDANKVERTAAKRAHWAATALAASAVELHQIDAEASARFAVEADRVTHLLDRGVQLTDRSPVSRATARGRGNLYYG
jgi:hypothetical protein